MKLHELKIEWKYYNDIRFADKKFELRKNDRDFQVGDLIKFYVPFKHSNGDVEWNPTQDYFKITYVLKNCEKFGLKKGYCIFGIKQVFISEIDPNANNYISYAGEPIKTGEIEWPSTQKDK